MARLSAKVVSDFLWHVGTDADDVAQRLREKKILGKPCNEIACPLARAIRELDEGAVVRVNGFNAFVSYNEPSQIVTVALPIACQVFVQKFDLGDYPFLIEK
jgi:hypothetical protein